MTGFFFYWGAYSFTPSVELFFSATECDELQYVGYVDLEPDGDLVNSAKKAITSAYNDDPPSYTLDDTIYCTYIKGDFSKSLKYMSKTYDDMRYSLIARNCVQTSTRALYRGNFEGNNGIEKVKMAATSLILFPNIAHAVWNKDTQGTKRAIKDTINALWNEFMGLFS